MPIKKLEWDVQRAEASGGNVFMTAEAGRKLLNEIKQPVKQLPLHLFFKSLLPGACFTSYFVGSGLTIINQFEAVFGNEPVQWIKVGLTYLVPALVYVGSATYNIRLKNSV